MSVGWTDAAWNVVVCSGVGIDAWRDGAAGGVSRWERSAGGSGVGARGVAAGRRAGCDGAGG